MVGSIRWNTAAGAVGLVLTYLASATSNGAAISMLRGMYAFILLFLLTFALRAVIKLILSEQGQNQPVKSTVQLEDQELGGSFEAITPQEDDINDLLKAGWEGKSSETPQEFKPFEPKRLVTTKDRSPEELTEALRQLADTEQSSGRE